MTKCKVNVKDAIKFAFDFFNETKKIAFSGSTITHVLLESIEYDETSNAWEVTIGFDTGRIGSKTREAPSVVNFFNKGNTVKMRLKRDFRILMIDANDGKFIKMMSC